MISGSQAGRRQFESGRPLHLLPLSSEAIPRTRTEKGSDSAPNLHLHHAPSGEFPPDG
jgi:hypothetical protein